MFCKIILKTSSYIVKLRQGNTYFSKIAKVTASETIYLSYCIGFLFIYKDI